MTDDQTDPFIGEPLAKARTMPEMIGAFPVKGLLFALFPIWLSVVFHGTWYLLALLIFTGPVAYFAVLTDIYIFDVFFAALNCKPSRTKRLWGAKRYVPR